MAKLILCDPVGEVATAVKGSPALHWSADQRIATLFNNHVSSHRVWRRLEDLLAAQVGASAVSTFAKENTFAPAPEETIANLLKKADLAIVGVGA
jgi:predicted oxidoreductase (fatty acid repression mutant protein)